MAAIHRCKLENTLTPKELMEYALGFSIPEVPNNDYIFAVQHDYNVTRIYSETTKRSGDLSGTQVNIYSTASYYYTNSGTHINTGPTETSRRLDEGDWYSTYDYYNSDGTILMIPKIVGPQSKKWIRNRTAPL